MESSTSRYYSTSVPLTDSPIPLTPSQTCSESTLDPIPRPPNPEPPEPLPAKGRLTLLSDILLAIAMAISFLLVLAFSFAYAAAHGVIMMLVGNAILRALGLSGYGADLDAAGVGAAGGTFAYPCISFVLHAASTCLPKTEDELIYRWYVTIVAKVLVGALSGAIGASILLLRTGEDLGGLDVLHAVRAGAFGGLVVSPALVFLSPRMSVGLQKLWTDTMSVVRAGKRKLARENRVSAYWTAPKV